MNKRLPKHDVELIQVVVPQPSKARLRIALPSAMLARFGIKVDIVCGAISVIARRTDLKDFTDEQVGYINGYTDGFGCGKFANNEQKFKEPKSIAEKVQSAIERTREEISAVLGATKRTSTLPETGFLRLTQIIGNPRATPPVPALIPVCKSTWWNGVASGRFPKAHKLSEGVTAWRVEDIRELIEKEWAQ